MVTQQSNEATWKRLKELWESERKPGFVIMGGTTYSVFTPNGDDDPVFNPSSDTTMYSSTSSGNSGVAAPKEPSTNPQPGKVSPAKGTTSRPKAARN